MSSEVLRALTDKKKKHSVGSLNNEVVRMVNQGAVAEEDIDNYMIVESGFSKEGVRTFKLLSDIKKKGYLVATPENVMSDLGENIGGFFNGKGERGRLVIQDFGMRFECSNVVASDGASEIKVGQSAYFDPEKKSFVVDVKSSDEKLATAGNKYLVVDVDGNTLGGQQTIRLEVAQ